MVNRSVLSLGACVIVGTVVYCSSVVTSDNADVISINDRPMANSPVVRSRERLTSEISDRKQHKTIKLPARAASAESSKMDHGFKAQNICDTRCQQVLASLVQPDSLPDQHVESAMAMSGELSAYLHRHPDIRAELANSMLMVDGNKRRVILAVFARLHQEGRHAVGQALIASPDWRQRKAGVNFMLSSDSINDVVAKTLSNMLITEENAYVKSSLIKALDQPKKYAGEPQILDTLSYVSNWDLSPMIKGQAMLARVRLEPKPENVIADAINAVRSDSQTFADFGVQAIEAVLSRQSISDKSISPSSRRALTELIEELMSPEAYDMPPELRRHLDDLLARFL